MDGKEVENDVGVLCKKQGVDGNKNFKASAIGSWLELWRALILVLILKKLMLLVYRKDWI